MKFEGNQQRSPEMGTFNDHPRGVQPSGWKRGTLKGDDMVCSIWRHIAVRENGGGIANRPEHKVKRSGFKFGIGRELYTAPFIWVNSDRCNLVQRSNGYTCNDRFKVAKIAIEENPETGRRKITGIRIVNEKTGQIVFSWKEG